MDDINGVLIKMYDINVISNWTRWVRTAVNFPALLMDICKPVVTVGSDELHLIVV